jgi:hypothetical protein
LISIVSELLARSVLQVTKHCNIGTRVNPAVLRASGLARTYLWAVSAVSETAQKSALRWCKTSGLARKGFRANDLIGKGRASQLAAVF